MIVDGEESLDENRKLFANLAAIQLLKRRIEMGTFESHEGEGAGWKDPVSELIGLIEKNTRDYRWRDSIARANGRSENKKWTEMIQEEVNNAIAHARDSKNAVHIGNTLTLYGFYDDALKAYLASPHYSMLTMSNMQIFQKAWSRIAVNLGQHFDDWCDSLDPNPDPADWPGNPSNATFSSPAYTSMKRRNAFQCAESDAAKHDTLLNLALAYWFNREPELCLAVLLNLESAVSGVWLNFRNIQAMLFICSLLIFDSDTFTYFRCSDPVGRLFNMKDLLEVVTQANIDDIWYVILDLELPLYDDNDYYMEQLREKLSIDWLQLHNKIPLDLVLKKLAPRVQSDTVYSRNELLRDIRAWEVPYELDLINECVMLISTEEQENIYAIEMRNTARNLAWDYKRDSLVTLWLNHKETMEIDDEAASDDDEPDDDESLDEQ